MNRLERTSVPVVALSHPGVKRKENEDRFGVSAFTLGPEGPKPILLAVLSDGIGGHRAGEVAAEMAVNIISHYVAASDTRNPPDTLVDAVQSASDAIRDQATHIPEQAGMGATCACAWVIGNRLYTATVGDTRIYLMRDGKIQRLSTDHTWVQEAIDRGVLHPDQANSHPNAHVIRRYLGSPIPPEVDLRLHIMEDENNMRGVANQGMLLFSGDRLLLTSDGVTDLISDGELLETYQKNEAEAASKKLVELALARGGHDNITLVSFEIPAELQAAQPAPKRQRSPLRWVMAGCLGVLGVAALVVLLAGGWLLFQDRLVLPNPFASPSATPTVQIVLPLDTPAPEEAPTLTPQAPAEVTATPTSPQTTLPPLDLGGPTLTAWPTNTRTSGGN